MSDKIRVLMVDDEAKFRESTAKILQKRGFDITMAGTGEEALDMLRENPRDVVVLDIKMPGLDGHAALAAIRESHPDTQVIMLTGHGDEASAKASLSLGACDYLNKPCDIDLLTSKINDAYSTGKHKEAETEKTAGDIMIQVEDYTTISADKTIKEAIELLMDSFEGLTASKRVMETGHRSILVFDGNDRLAGILSIRDLIREIRPAYLSAPKPSLADSMQYSSMFWSGLFSSQMEGLSKRKVEEIMSDVIISADESTNLMELADMMYVRNIRRLVITRDGDVVGVVREQELFFEMAHLVLR